MAKHTLTSACFHLFLCVHWPESSWCLQVLPLAGDRHGKVQSFPEDADPTAVEGAQGHHDPPGFPGQKWMCFPLVAGGLGTVPSATLPGVTVRLSCWPSAGCLFSSVTCSPLSAVDSVLLPAFCGAGD